jgi:hypothetical protein
MDRVIKCARIWNRTEWTMCSSVFERYFLKVQKKLANLGVISSFAVQVRPPSFYEEDSLGTVLSGTSAADGLELPQQRSIVFLETLLPTTYSKRHKQYLFSQTRGNGTFLRPSEIARGRHVHVLPAQDLSIVLAYCFFHHEGFNPPEYSNEDIPLQIHWMSSILGIDRSRFLNKFEDTSTTETCSHSMLISTEIPTWTPLSSPRFAVFYDGTELQTELVSLYSLLMSEDASSGGWTPPDALLRRSRFAAALKGCSSPVIRQAMERTDFCFPDLRPTEEISSRAALPSLFSCEESCDERETLDMLRVDRCFPGDRIVSGNFQSRLFVVIMWTHILFSNAMEGSMVLASMNAFKLCISSLILRMASEPHTFSVAEYLSGARETMLGGVRGPTQTRLVDSAIQDVYYYSMLLVNTFQGYADQVVTALDRLFPEKILQFAASSHMSAIAISQQLQWPPYHGYRQLMKSIIPSDGPLYSKDEHTEWMGMSVPPSYTVDIDDVAYPVQEAYGFFLWDNFLRSVEDISEMRLLSFATKSYASTIPLLDTVHHLLKDILFYQRVYGWWQHRSTHEEEDCTDVDSVPPFLIRPSPSQRGKDSSEELDTPQASPEYHHSEGEEGEEDIHVEIFGDEGEEMTLEGITRIHESADSTDEAIAEFPEFPGFPGFPGFQGEACAGGEKDAYWIRNLSQSLSPLFSCDGVSLDAEDPIILPKATFFVLPVPMGEHQCGWLCRWDLDKSKLHHAPIFDPHTLGVEYRVDAFMHRYTQRFTALLRLGAYTLFRVNETIQTIDHFGHHLCMPCYPVVSCSMEQTCDLFRWTRTHVNSDNFEDASNLVSQTLDALVYSEAALDLRMLDARMFYGTIGSGEHQHSIEQVSHVLSQPARYLDSLNGLFFILSIPYVWPILYEGFIQHGQVDTAIKKLRSFYRLFSSYDLAKTVVVPDDGQQDLLSVFRTVRVRGHVGVGADYEEFCPTLLDLVSENHLDIPSCSWDEFHMKKKKKEEDECEVFDISEDSTEPSVEYQRTTPAKWFFFSRMSWSRFLGYCIEHVWKEEKDYGEKASGRGGEEGGEEEPSPFALLVLELFMHGFSMEEFRELRRRMRQEGPFTPSSHFQAKELKSRVPRSMYASMGLGLRRCGYRMYPSTVDEEDRSEVCWNAFGCVSMLLEYSLETAHQEEMERVFARSGVDKDERVTTLPFLMDYLTRPGMEESVDEKRARWDASPVELILMMERRVAMGRVERISLESTNSWFQVRRYGDTMFLPERLPGLGWQHFSGRNISSFAADMLYLFGRTPTGFL